VKGRQNERAGEAWSASEGRWEVYLEQKATYEPPTEVNERIEVDTSKPLVDQIKSVEEFPQTHAGPLSIV
jgi:hypothetical protein